MIHATAIIDPTVKLGANVQVGPYCVITGNVEIGDGCVLQSHVVISGDTKIGKNNTFFPFCNVGARPQDLKFKNEESRTEIGDNNTIREHVTIHSGTEGGGNVTKIGNNCLLMVGVHIAHDCIVGNNVILANNATLAGHVQVGDFAVLGGLSAVHQFARIGAHAMIGGLSGIEGDVVPYGNAFGERAHLEGLNLTGLKRRGFSKEDIHALRSAFRSLFHFDGRTFDERMKETKEQFANNETVMEIIEFINEDSSRSLCQPKR
jgi:UDP-N-acetylglucosamine acyltransferase